MRIALVSFVIAFAFSFWVKADETLCQETSSSSGSGSTYGICSPFEFYFQKAGGGFWKKGASKPEGAKGSVGSAIMQGGALCHYFHPDKPDYYYVCGQEALSAKVTPSFSEKFIPPDTGRLPGQYGDYRTKRASIISKNYTAALENRVADTKSLNDGLNRIEEHLTRDLWPRTVDSMSSNLASRLKHKIESKLAGVLPPLRNNNPPPRLATWIPAQGLLTQPLLKRDERIRRATSPLEKWSNLEPVLVACLSEVSGSTLNERDELELFASKYFDKNWVLAPSVLGSEFGRIASSLGRYFVSYPHEPNGLKVRQEMNKILAFGADRNSPNSRDSVLGLAAVLIAADAAFAAGAEKEGNYLVAQTQPQSNARERRVDSPRLFSFLMSTLEEPAGIGSYLSHGLRIVLGESPEVLWGDSPINRDVMLGIELLAQMRELRPIRFREKDLSRVVTSLGKRLRASETFSLEEAEAILVGTDQ